MKNCFSKACISLNEITVSDCKNDAINVIAMSKFNML